MQGWIVADGSDPKIDRQNFTAVHLSNESVAAGQIHSDTLRAALMLTCDPATQMLIVEFPSDYVPLGPLTSVSYRFDGDSAHRDSWLVVSEVTGMPPSIAQLNVGVRRAFINRAKSATSLMLRFTPRGRTERAITFSIDNFKVVAEQSKKVCGNSAL